MTLAFALALGGLSPAYASTEDNAVSGWGLDNHGQGRTGTGPVYIIAIAASNSHSVVLTAWRTLWIPISNWQAAHG
jgi:hypothetical protein